MSPDYADLKHWHDRTCPAYLPWAAEMACECGGAERHFKAHYDAGLRRARCLDCGAEPARTALHPEEPTTYREEQG